MKYLKKFENVVDINRNLLNYVILNDIYNVKKSIKDGANINHVDVYRGTNLLQISIEQDYDEISIELIDSGVDVNFKDSNNDTPIVYAIKMYNIEIVKKLIMSNSDLNVVNDDGRTPLIIAVHWCAMLDSSSSVVEKENKQKLFDIIKLLIKGGANLEKANISGFTPIVIAGMYMDIDVIELLIESGANICVDLHDDYDFMTYLNRIDIERISTKFPDKYKEYLIYKEAKKYNI